MESILNTIKQMLGPNEDVTAFDTDIIFFINSAFSELNQMGVGPEDGFSIEDLAALWDDFIPNEDKRYGMVKEYIYLSVKLGFDPPTNSSVLTSMERRKDRLEWRLYTLSQTKTDTDSEVDENGSDV